MDPESHKWSPITDLSSHLVGFDDSAVRSLVQAWHGQRQELEERGVYEEYVNRLRREFAVETGALEEIYRISEGATKTLIERGLDADLIAHEDAGGESPTDVVAKIHDQHDAIEGVYLFVSSQRVLSKHYILQLHQVVTRHQETHQARDTLGQLVLRKMPRGQWKTSPNNVEGPNGFRFEFCPPEQVESEMDRLLQMHEQHVADGVSPLVEAAWLHHGFSLIHPFTDGNGRIARLLASAILLKADWLPLLVRRSEKMKYIHNLREADGGDLRPLIELFGRLQQRAARETLSLGRDTMQEATQRHGVLESIRAKFERQKRKVTELIIHARRTVDSLHALAGERLSLAKKEIQPILDVAERDYQAYVTEGRRDTEKAHYNHYQVIECAKRLGYFANLESYRSWSALTLATESKTEILFSFHGLGYGSTGVYCCAGMMYSRRTDDAGKSIIGEVTPLGDDLFEFAYAEDPENVQKRFSDWIEECVTIAVTKWSEEIG